MACGLLLVACDLCLLLDACDLGLVAFSDRPGPGERSPADVSDSLKLIA